VVLGLLALPAMISAQNVTPTVTVTQNDTLGSFLADGNGMTLYLFLKDEPGVTNCYGTCAENWPPLLVEGDPVAGDGVDAAMLGTTERTDGAIQVTYNGWPLYYYAKDVAPGDTVGQEVGNVWYVVSPAGEQIPPAAAAAAEVAATEAMTETTAMTDTMAMTDTAAMTETMAMTDTAAMA
ncbi:MAG: hypothetical protein KDB57_12975, partial [Solirubrobacterales bacterium]|nr:hypothetical protein [Solirubrobacterales bacterium]